MHITQPADGLADPQARGPSSWTPSHFGVVRPYTVNKGFGFTINRDRLNVASGASPTAAATLLRRASHRIPA